MTRVWLRAALAGVLGAVVGASAFVTSVRARSDVTLEMDRRLPRFVSGLYPPERHKDETFAWTSGRAEIVLQDIDRRVAWQCAIRLRSGRPESDSAEPPLVELAIDGRPAMARVAPAAYQDFTAGVPADGSRRLTVTLSSPTFSPGAADSRALGVQVDRVRCTSTGPPMPSATAILAAAVPPAAFGIALGASGVAFGGLLGLTILIAVLQAAPLATTSALYSQYGESAAALALVMTMAAVLLQKGAERWAGRAWHGPARLALGISVAALFLELLVLLHPDKPTVDAVFHAHRLDWVLAGRFFFTQPIQDAVEFPYAVGLYVFAAPWSLLTDNHVALLRIVVSTAQAIAGGLLYLMIARGWQDRSAAAAAVALFHGVPIAFGVVGNANLTNAFGQSAALITIAVATIWSLHWRQAGQMMGLIALAALAFLSHVSTFALLGVTLAAIGVLGAWRGFRASGARAGAILLCTAAAGVLAIGLYYGHFSEVHRMFAGAQTPVATTAPEPSMGATETLQPSREPVSFGKRLVDAFRFGARDVGWPLLVLAAVGLWRLWTDRARDRLTLTLAGWAVAYVVFIAAGTLSPVDTRYERYAHEFISRVDLATYPAVVVLAARGSLWLWRHGLMGRVLAVAFWIGAGHVAFRHWMGWLV